jgi:putative phage-type endonuclease
MEAYMKIIELQQSSNEWLTWRQNGVGASDVPIILGTSPYKTKLQLWNDKCGFGKKQELNEAMKHGIMNEEKAREWVNNELKLNLEPLCVEDDERGYIRASLDGWDKSNEVLVEIKCPTSIEVLMKALEAERIHGYWMDQIHWQMMITKPKKAYAALFDWRDETCILIEIKRDEEKEAKMTHEASVFWNMVVTGNAPDASDRDYIEVTDPKLEILTKEYIEVAKEEKTVKERKKELKTKIEDFGDDMSFEAYGLKVKRCQPTTTYDLRAMKEDGIDIEKYKKEPKSIGFYKIMVPKNLIV